MLTEWATGSGNGKTATCTLRCETAASGALVLGADDTYRSPTTSLGICPSGLPFDVPDEVGTVVHRRRRLVLKIGNRAEIVSALRRCTGRRFALKRYGTTVQLDADGTHLSGTNRLQIVIPGTYATHAGVVVHFKGALGGTPAPLEPPSRQLPVCSPDLRPVCVVR